MQADGLVLRDIHAATAPPWWPPAPGWWLAAGVVALVAALALAWWLHRRRQRRRIERMFDDAMRNAQSPARQVAAMSELLRRAARRQAPHADTLHGDAWLHFLDADAPVSAGTNVDVEVAPSLERKLTGESKLKGEPKSKFKRNIAVRTPLFQGDCGQLLLEGGFRRELDADAVAALRQASRTRFIEWMTARR